ncbi:hypothetical protein OAG24_00825 [bacterium]|nr:hypothetical protein [bacterium]
MRLEVLSINYDFIPSSLESPKSLWVELKRPPPNNFQVGTIIKLIFEHPKNQQFFSVDDIVGKKIVLRTVRDKREKNSCSQNFNRWGWSSCSGGQGRSCPSKSPQFSECGLSFSTSGNDACNSRKSSTIFDVSNRCPQYSADSTIYLEYNPICYKVGPAYNYEWCCN